MFLPPGFQGRALGAACYRFGGAHDPELVP